MAIDSLGDVWSLNSGDSLAEYSNTGTVLSAGYTGGGLSSPAALTIDGSGQVWIANGNNSFSVFNNVGSAISGGTGYTSSTLSGPSSIAVDISGNLWISNASGNSVTEVLGAAAPTLAPLSTGVANSDLATKP